jgi:hypothetical protein
MRSSVTSVRNISLFLKNLKQRSVYYWRYRFRPHARDWARRVPRGVRSRLREARLAHPGAFWAAVFGIIPVAIVVAIFISGTAAGVWAAYHSNREDIAPLGTFVTAIGVIIAAAIALMRHFAQTEADRQRRIVESFSKAVEQLGSDKLELRVGAIFALERLSRESPDDYWTIMEVLTAFVRERMRYTTIMARLSERAYFLWMQAGRPESRSEEFWVEAVRLERLDQTPTDVAAILTVIKRRSVENQRREEDRGWRFDLQGTYLRKANLTEFVLKAANLKAAHFEEADLSDAHLMLARMGSRSIAPNPFMASTSSAVGVDISVSASSGGRGNSRSGSAGTGIGARTTASPDGETLSSRNCTARKAIKAIALVRSWAARTVRIPAMSLSWRPADIRADVGYEGNSGRDKAARSVAASWLTVPFTYSGRIVDQPQGNPPGTVARWRQIRLTTPTLYTRRISA